MLLGMVISVDTCKVMSADTPVETHLSRTRIELPMFLLFSELRMKKKKKKHFSKRSNDETLFSFLTS